jgi:hypothetical protein
MELKGEENENGEKAGIIYNRRAKG